MVSKTMLREYIGGYYRYNTMPRSKFIVARSKNELPPTMLHPICTTVAHNKREAALSIKDQYHGYRHNQMRLLVKKLLKKDD